MAVHFEVNFADDYQIKMENFKFDCRLIASDPMKDGDTDQKWYFSGRAGIKSSIAEESAANFVSFEA